MTFGLLFLDLSLDHCNNFDLNVFYVNGQRNLIKEKSRYFIKKFNFDHHRIFIKDQNVEQIIKQVIVTEENNHCWIYFM